MEARSLLQNETLSEEIIIKLGHDFINRYELKQQFVLDQFNKDSNQLQAQLLLYHRSIQQMKTQPQFKNTTLSKTMDQILFKLYNFFIRLINKHCQKQKSHNKKINLVQNRCQECAENMNAKRIQSVKRQLIDSIPLLNKKQLEETQNNNLFDMNSAILTQDQVVGKMVKLQRNLNQKQQGIIRCIDQFQDFRVNLMIGRPKYSDQQLHNKFKAKQYVFKVGVYFSEKLKQIQNKINNLKNHCKTTQDFSVQCYSQAQLQTQTAMKTQLQNSKVTTLKNEAQIRRLNQSCHKLEQSVKMYSMQMKLLNNKVSELDLENHNLKQQVFIEKMKTQSKETKLAETRQLLLKKSKGQSKKNGESNDDMELISSIIGQLYDRKSEIEQIGIESQEVLPYVKTAFKKIIDGMLLNKKKSLVSRRKGLIFDPSDLIEEESPQVMQMSSHKKSRSSLKGSAAVISKRDFKNQNSNKYQQKGNGLQLISRQLSYKIPGTRKYHGIRNMASSNDKKSSGSIMEQSGKRQKTSYKRSTFQTEGNVNNLKKRAMHIKLSSISSDVKDELNLESSEKQQTLECINNNLLDCQTPQSIQNDKQSITFSIGSNQYRQQLRRQHRNRNSKNSLKNLRKNSSSILNILKQHQVVEHQGSRSIIRIKSLNGSKIIEPQILSNFFDPPLQNHTNTKCATTCADTQQIGTESQTSESKAGASSMFNRLKKTGKSQFFNTSLDNWNSPKSISKNGKRQPLRLQEISFMTSFFSLMAKSHLVNDYLYNQMRNCILDSNKENQISSKNGEEAMMKQIVGQLVTRHRKCVNSKAFCSHLSSFLEAFSDSIE